MTEVLAAIIGLCSSVMVTGITLLGAKRLGIGPNQNLLISTYKDIMDADRMRIEQLEKLVEEKDRRIEELEAEKNSSTRVVGTV